MKLSLVKPYTSLTLARIAHKRGGAVLVREILDEVEKLLDFEAPQSTRKLIGRIGPVKRNDLTVGFLHYEESRRPTWTSDSKTKDVINQIVVVCLRHDHAAIVLTDTARSRAIVRRFSGEGAGLSALEAIQAGTLNAAFAEGAVRTLWLSGIHAPTSVKADSKVLIGGDIRDALDPLGDQSYYFTAARCVTALNSHLTPVGSSPRRSHVWIGPSSSWGQFREYVSSIFDCLEAVEKKGDFDEAPIPILATPISHTVEVRDAYDISVIPPEVSEDDSDPAIRMMHEKWAYEGRFEVVSTADANLAADVWLDQAYLGRLEIQVDASNPHDVQYEILPEAEDGQSDVLQQFVDLCKHRHWLQIRYESGYTLSHGTLYSARLRDFRFDNWRFADFTDFDLSKEKPAKKKAGRQVFTPEDVGKKDSLFCWVSKNWPDLTGKGSCRGWLACDDGSMEIADFIHLDTSIQPALLSLIHVKGAHGSGISVSDYEVVTAQAQKNLRYLDQIILDQGLEQGLKKQIGKLVWLDGKRQSGRAGILKALKEAGENVRRLVVVLQPRVSFGALESALAEKDAAIEKKSNNFSRNAMRLVQLETMLVAAQNSCRNLGAEFWVVTDGARTPAVIQEG